MAEKEQALEVEGIVTQALANTRFRVQITGGHIVNAHVAGKMRKNFIRIVRSTPQSIHGLLGGTAEATDGIKAPQESSPAACGAEPEAFHRR